MKFKPITILKQLTPRKMWAQMLCVLLAVVSISLGILGIMLMRTSQHAVEESVLRDHKQIAIRAAGEVEAFLNNPKNLLMNTASLLGTLNVDFWRQETVLVELALNHEIFERVAVLDLTGKELVSSEPGRELRLHARDVNFGKLAREGYTFSEVRFSDRHLPYMIMTVPIRVLGKISQILMAEISMRGLWDIVDEIQIGRTGQAYVVAENGILVAHRDKKLVLENKNFSSEPVVRTVLSGHIASAELSGMTGQHQLVSYAPIRNFGWGLVFTQSAQEAYSYLTTMKTNFWIIIMASLTAIGLTSILIARWVVTPMKILSRQTKAVAEGDFSELAVQRVDEIGDLMRSFNKMTQQLKEAKDQERLSIVGKAASAIAHELKNSLVMVNTFIQLFPKRLDDQNFIRKFVKVVPQELDRWKGMLKELADFTKHSKITLQETDMEKVLRDIQILIEDKAVEQKITLDIVIEHHLSLIWGNAEKLTQALMNIIINAFEAMPQGGKLSLCARTLKRRTDRDTGILEISVEDTGGGIPNKMEERLFDPFVTTKPSSLGLGLSICRDIVSQHNGEIRLMSEPGRGTRFTITFPFYQPRVTIKEIAEGDVALYGRREDSSH